VHTSNETPPVVLLEHPPLAAFTNAVLAALNDLRLCAPLGIAHSVTKCLQNSLGIVVAETTSFYRLVKSCLFTNLVSGLSNVAF
jgi:hypothetical protein